ncbi:nuclear protein, partial [Colletotrichum tofieldiae]
LREKKNQNKKTTPKKTMATVTEAPANTIKPEQTSSEVEITQKRKVSIDSGDGDGLSKRPRIEDGDHRDPATDPRPRDGDAVANTNRRAPLSKDEEKKRGKRLFGGLLSTLSQTNTGSQHKKRREIEQRQHERAQKQRAEDEKRRTEKLARITEARLQEQIKFDEKAMKSRHASMLAMAHSLRTKAGPSVYYRPWKLTKEQEGEIDDQIQDAKAVIARETEAFRDRKEEHGRRYGPSRPPTRDEAPALTVTENPAKAHSEPPVETMTVTNNIPSPHHQHDEPGDVVEDAEDMVIY